MSVPIHLPQSNANDTTATLVRWLVASGSQVERGEPIAIFETTKAAVEVESPAAGWLVTRAAVGDSVDVGGLVAEVLPHPPEKAEAEASPAVERVITAKARRLMEKHGVTEAALPEDLRLVREQDIAALVGPAATTEADQTDAVLERADYRELMDLMSALRQRMKRKFNRHVPSGTLLNDRWRLAESYGFGAGTSVYDECLILGDVSVGQNCWIGPYTVLDGSGGGLEIGDWSSIGTGTHVYTHHTIDQVLTGGAVKPFGAPTRIGRCCFIAPMAMIAPGADIGDHSFVAAFSYIEGKFPPCSYLAGAPARVIGRIEVRGDRVTRRLFETS